MHVEITYSLWVCKTALWLGVILVESKNRTFIFLVGSRIDCFSHCMQVKLATVLVTLPTTLHSSWTLSVSVRPASRQASDGHVMTLGSAEGHTITLDLRDGGRVALSLSAAVRTGSGSGSGIQPFDETEDFGEIVGPVLNEAIFTPAVSLV